MSRSATETFSVVMIDLLYQWGVSEQGDLVAGGELGGALVCLLRGAPDSDLGQGEVVGDVGPAAAVLAHVGGEVAEQLLSTGRLTD